MTSETRKSMAVVSKPHRNSLSQSEGTLDDLAALKSLEANYDPGMVAKQGGQYRVVFDAVHVHPFRLHQVKQLGPEYWPEMYARDSRDPRSGSTMPATLNTYRELFAKLTSPANDVDQQHPSQMRRKPTTNQKSVQFQQDCRYLKSMPQAKVNPPRLKRSNHFEQFLATGINFQANEGDSTSPDDRSQSQLAPTSQLPITTPIESNAQTTANHNESRHSDSAMDNPKLTEDLGSSSSFALPQELEFDDQRLPTYIESNDPPPIKSRLKDSKLSKKSSTTTSASAKSSTSRRRNSTEQQQKPYRNQDSTLGSKSECPMLNLPRIAPRLMPCVIDLKDRLPGLDILDAKIRDYDLNIGLKPGTPDKMRILYKKTILHNPILRKLLARKRPDMVPERLRHLIRMQMLYNRPEDGWLDTTNEEGGGNQEGGDQLGEDQLLIASLNKPFHANVALLDAEHLWLEVGVFTRGMFAVWMSEASKPSVPIESVDKLKLQLAEVAILLESRDNIGTYPGHRRLLGLLATCANAGQGSPLETTLWICMEGWLNALLAGLFSMDRATREITCYVLAYLFTQAPLVESIRQSSRIDVGRDVTLTIMSAFEECPTSLLHYFCLMALIVEGCPSFSVMRAISDKGPSSRSVLLNHLWPRLIYYALKYWHRSLFEHQDGMLLLQVLTEVIERAYMRSVSRKHAKLSQIQLGKRFQLLTNPSTIWIENWKVFEL